MPMRLSTNIESAEDIKWASHDYCPTRQATKFIEELSADSLRGGAAFALEGSYGSGKSSLLAFALSRVTRLADETRTAKTLDLPETKYQPLRSLHEAGGLIPLVFTGSTESLALKTLSVLKSFAADNPNAPGADSLRVALSKRGRNKRKCACCDV